MTPADTPACRLFDPAQLTEYRFKNGYANVSDCYRGYDDTGPMMVSLRENVTPEQYLAEPDGLKTSPITIGQHSGLLAENSGMTAAQVLTEAGGRACEIAQAVMKVVEPKLS